jgi:hypothetical protein
MVNSEYFRRQAAACLRFAAAIGDQKISAGLVAMADEFSAKADEIDPNLGSSAGAGTEDRGEDRGKDSIHARAGK